MWLKTMVKPLNVSNGKDLLQKFMYFSRAVPKEVMKLQ